MSRETEFGPKDSFDIKHVKHYFNDVTRANQNLTTAIEFNFQKSIINLRNIFLGKALKIMCC